MIPVLRVGAGRAHAIPSCQHLEAFEPRGVWNGGSAALDGFPIVSSGWYAVRNLCTVIARLAHVGHQRLRRTSSSIATAAVAFGAGSTWLFVHRWRQFATFHPENEHLAVVLPSFGTASPTIRTEECASACLCRGLAPPAAQAPPRHLLCRPRPGTYTNAPYDGDPIPQPPGAPNPTAVWNGKLAMLGRQRKWCRFERGQAVDADTQPRPHHAGDVARREWCGLVRRSRPACTNACLRGP